MSEIRRREIVRRLHDIGALKLDGPYKLKSGLESPYYVDLRLLVSYPDLLDLVGQAIWDILCENSTIAQGNICLCGVPYTALPMATAISVKQGVPMLMRRKEVKAYGTKKEIEGDVESIIQQGRKCVVVEDLVTSGMSVFETIEPLTKAGLSVECVAVLLDREQGGRKNIEDRGMKLFSVLKISEALEWLYQDGRITLDSIKEIRKFISENQVAIEKNSISSKKSTIVHQTFEERALLAKNDIARLTFECMIAKKSNLCVSVDVTTKNELLSIANEVGPYICVLKTHIDIIEDFDQDLILQLVSLAKKHNFLIFEDRKFADIGNTVSLQYGKGIYKIASWAHITNCHALPGSGILQGLSKSLDGCNEPRGILLLAEMSSSNNLITPEYTRKVFKMAEANEGTVAGFICQNGLLKDENAHLNPQFIYMTPGVQIGKDGDSMGQQYRTPEKAIIEEHCDIVIVGRGIYRADNISHAAKSYRELSWSAYLRKTS